jgi:hypothetical protein
MSKEKEILNTVKTRKRQCLRQIQQNEDKSNVLQCILQGKVKRKRSVGRRNISWLKNLERGFP